MLRSFEVLEYSRLLAVNPSVRNLEYFLLPRLETVDLCSTPECLHSSIFCATIVSFPKVFEGKLAGCFPVGHTWALEGPSETFEEAQQKN